MTVLSMLRCAIPGDRARLFGTAAILAMALAAIPLALAQEGSPLPTRVGRLSNYSGEIYLAPQDHAGDWSPIALNYPVTSGDNLWTSQGARAEVDFGGSQMRMSASTNVNVANLDDHRIDVFVAQGDIIVRLGALDAGDSAVIDTPTTQVVLVRPGLYRIEVSPDQQQTTLTIRVGEATAQVTAGLQQVLAGMTAVIANGSTTAAEFSAAYPLDGFDSWSASRERYFRQGRNPTYVSPQMVGYADLANYGSWQPSPEYGNVWFPNSVAVGWAPYSDGYWTTVAGFGLTWVDRAPWGYAPFHYGRWAYVGDRWGWCPGAYVARPVWAPALVAWTGGGLTISVAGGGPAYGWVALGWRDPYQPWWDGCGVGCWDRYNQPYQVDLRDRDRYRDHAPPADRYANWRVPGAVTAVAGAQLIARKPYVGSERVSLTGTALTSVRPVTSAPPLVKPSPNRIPMVPPGSQGTPAPASTFYATSKPAQLGLQRPAMGRSLNVQRGGIEASPNAAGSSGNKPPQPNAGTPMNRVGPGTPVTRPAQVQSPQSATQGNVGVPMQTLPFNRVAPRNIPPQQNYVAPSVNGNVPAPRMQTESRVVNGNVQAPRMQTEQRVVNGNVQAPRMQTEQRVVPQQVIRAPPVQRQAVVRPAPAANNAPHPNGNATPANQNAAPRAGNGNEAQTHPPGKVEREKDKELQQQH